MAQQLSRQELYELVWSEPRTALAKRLGVSDTALAKVCTRAGIPMPARGYWARLAAGKPGVRAGLPDRGLGQSGFVQFGRPAYRAVAENDPVEVPPEPCFGEPPEALPARAEALLLRCRVPRGLQKPHPLIAALIEEDGARRRAAGTDRFALQQPRFDSGPGQRRLRIANALFVAMAHAGCQPSVSSRELDKIGFRIGDTFIGVDISTPGGMGSRGGGVRTVPGDGITLTVLWPRLSGVTTTWSDTEAGAVEDRIPGIARDLLVMGELAYRQHVLQQYQWQLERRKKFEAGIQAERDRREREEREGRLREETARREWLLGQAANRRHAEEIRGLVSATDARYEGSLEALSSTYRQWRAWALAQADLLDPCLGTLAALVGPPSAGERPGPAGSTESEGGQVPRVRDGSMPAALTGT